VTAALGMEATPVAGLGMKRQRILYIFAWPVCSCLSV